MSVCASTLTFLAAYRSSPLWTSLLVNLHIFSHQRSLTSTNQTLGFKPFQQVTYFYSLCRCQTPPLAQPSYGSDYAYMPFYVSSSQYCKFRNALVTSLLLFKLLSADFKVQNLDRVGAFEYPMQTPLEWERQIQFQIQVRIWYAFQKKKLLHLDNPLPAKS